MNQKVKWSILAAVACVFWGISGLFGKNLFNSNPLITPIFLTKIRMVISGIIILLFAAITKQKPFAIWKNKKDALNVAAYGLLGLVPVQLFYFIGERSKCVDCYYFTICRSIFCNILDANN